jgi:hypothetical protein
MGVCCTATDNKNKIPYKKESDSVNSKNQLTNLNAEGGSNTKPTNPITLDQINKSIDQWKEITKKRKMKIEQQEENNILLKDLDGDIKGCINEMVQFDNDMNKRDKNILLLHTNLFANTEGIDYSNGEIMYDFQNMNKKGNTFDISSTIHFTVLNSKDLASSKINKLEKNVLNNISKSQSIFCVLDELDLNNREIKINENYNRKLFIENNSQIKSIFF